MKVVLAWPGLSPVTRQIILSLAGHVEDGERGRGRP
jgi:hypothetical protein